MGMDMAKMMKQAQEMQKKLAEAQGSMKDVVVDASAGGGVVKASVNGDLEVVSVTIDKDAVDPDDVEFLQDMIVAAVNEAIRGVSDMAAKKMSSITAGMNIPGMPF